MSEFEDDLRRAKEGLESARAELLRVVDEADGRYDAGRRGGWTIAQVLQHTIDSENHYAAGIEALRGRSPGRPQPVEAPTSSTAARHGLERARQRLIEALSGIDEETFYRMGTLLHQDYSVLSVLENVELHDHEHSAQIRQLLDA